MRVNYTSSVPQNNNTRDTYTPCVLRVYNIMQYNVVNARITVVQ